MQFYFNKLGASFRREGFVSGIRHLTHEATLRTGAYLRGRTLGYSRRSRTFVEFDPLCPGQPIAAVIIPCFNYGAYVEEAVESALKQTLQNVQVIVVDDGSTDERTRHVLRKLESIERIRVMHQPNRGLSAARNAGINATQARYICCLDADDRIDQTYLEKTVALLEVRKDIGIGYPLVKLFGDEDRIWRTRDLDARLLLERNTIPAAAVFRREAWEQVGGYDEDMRLGYEDWEFWLRIARLGYRGRLVPDLLIEHRRHGRTMTHHAQERHQELAGVIRDRHRNVTRTLRKLPTYVPVEQAFSNLSRRPSLGTDPFLVLARVSHATLRELDSNALTAQATTVCIFQRVPLRMRSKLVQMTLAVYVLPDFLMKEYHTKWIEYMTGNHAHHASTT